MGKFKNFLIHKLGGATMEEVEKTKRLDRIAEAIVQRGTPVFPITLSATSCDPNEVLPVEILYHDCTVKVLQQAERHIRYSGPDSGNMVKAELLIMPITNE